MRRLMCAAVAACLAVADAGCGQSHRAVTGRASTASTQAKASTANTQAKLLSPQPSPAATTQYSDHGPRATTTRSMSTSTTPTTTTCLSLNCRRRKDAALSGAAGTLSAHGTSYAILRVRGPLLAGCGPATSWIKRRSNLHRRRRLGLSIASHGQDRVWGRTEQKLALRPS